MMTVEEEMGIYEYLQKIYVLLDDGDRRALRQVELTPTQYNLLQRLGTVPEEGLTITKLARLLLCTRGNVTRLVRRLEQQGLVLLSGDANDQRLVRVTLTPTGVGRLQAARAAHTASIQRRFQELEPAIRQQLAELTHQVAALLEADLARQTK
ncbi:MAG: MarR family transcriptional regulator [Chloroflexi bacterium]|nr:MarR family transcriptional regulator [Chloroflexota bacterium]MCI0578766.1 MarR family transcriptional regulator [Chloroflexota bacterium]MCI0648737.1 MarR family transcriptional regulator [Chloroflexota bacterium]MCI0731665.1 MarR family transcriptional regulator [Chloroflexota bacterium]